MISRVRRGIRFSERMSGTVESNVEGEKASPIEVVLTIESNDLDDMVRDDEHAARVHGTLECTALGDDPLTVTQGIFNLFARKTERVETHVMKYQLRCQNRKGESYLLCGEKTIFNHPSQHDLWRDISRLKFRLLKEREDGSVEDGKREHPGWKGTLEVYWADVPRIILSARVLNAKTRRQRVGGLIRFGVFYVTTLFRHFGRPFAPSRVVSPFDVPAKHPNPEEPPLPDPKPYPVNTEDGAVIWVTRYRDKGTDGNGRKGPVIIAPGFGMSTYAFVLPTLKQNLTHFLVRKGYDVWLLDYRASERSEASGTQFTMDDIARYDYPAAVDKVLEERRKDEEKFLEDDQTKSVQILGHCVGSGSLMMSLLGGPIESGTAGARWRLKGVRSAICSQFFTHMDQPLRNRIKARLHIGEILHWIGAWPTLNTDFDSRSPFMHRVLDVLLRLNPTRERCRNPVCRRAIALYGETHRHDQLNSATHDAVHEMFNRANLKTFRHLGRMIRRGKITPYQGRNTYLTSEAAAGLNLPIGLMQGEKNGIFRPRGLDRSYDWLTRQAKLNQLPKSGCTETGLNLYKKIWIDDPGDSDPESGDCDPDPESSEDRYGHLDCFIGRTAHVEVYPKILEELERGDKVAACLNGHSTSNKKIGSRGWTIPSPMPDDQPGGRLPPRTMTDRIDATKAIAYAKARFRFPVFWRRQWSRTQTTALLEILRTTPNEEKRELIWLLIAQGVDYHLLRKLPRAARHEYRELVKQHAPGVRRPGDLRVLERHEMDPHPPPEIVAVTNEVDTIDEALETIPLEVDGGDGADGGAELGGHDEILVLSEKQVLVMAQDGIVYDVNLEEAKAHRWARAPMMPAGAVIDPQDSGQVLFCVCRRSWHRYGTDKRAGIYSLRTPSGKTSKAGIEPIVTRVPFVPDVPEVDTDGIVYTESDPRSPTFKIDSLDPGNSRPICFPNDVAASSKGRFLFFTEPSPYTSMGDDSMVEVLTLARSALVWRVDRKENTIRLVAQNFSYLDGVIVEGRGESIIVGELARFRLLRLHFGGDRAGTTDELWCDLPGMPDGMQRDSDGRIWVALLKRRSRFVTLLHRTPWLRRIVMKVPRRFLPVPKGTGFLVLSPDGSIPLDCTMHSGRRITDIATIAPARDQIYLASYTDENRGLNRLPLRATGLTK